jgi:flagellar motor switch/type III secretory pathway protein FliN
LSADFFADRFGKTLQLTDMDSFQAKEKAAPKSEKEMNAADPFASDIFADSQTAETGEPEIEPQIEVEKGKSRVWRLPKVSRPAVDWNSLRRGLPLDFSEELPQMLAESMAVYLNFTRKNPIEFFLLTERETFETPETGDSWWLNIGIEQSEAQFAVEIADVFAVWLVDAMLENKLQNRARIRRLSPSETAVLEFLAVNLTVETNKIINAPLFKFRGLSRSCPDWTAENKTAGSENIRLVSNWQTVHGLLQSIVKIHLTADVLKALQPDENNLLTGQPRRAAMWNSFGKRVEEVRARLFLGDVPMTLADVAGLETGDVVLTENYGFSIVNGRLSGAAEIFLGDGETVKLAGAFEPPAAETPDETEGNSDAEILVRRVKSNNVLRFSIKRIEELETPQYLEKSMPKEENRLEAPEGVESDDDSNGGVPLENLAVTLRVELEAKRLSLAEVGNLRVNQIIELGARATDAVNLLIDNKTVALGELVEIEDRLGVRIIQILR